MVNRQLIEPESIVVVGASDNITKPGGKLLYNIRTGTFTGAVYALNPKKDTTKNRIIIEKLSGIICIILPTTSLIGTTIIGAIKTVKRMILIEMTKEESYFFVITAFITLSKI